MTTNANNTHSTFEEAFGGTFIAASDCNYYSSSCSSTSSSRRSSRGSTYVDGQGVGGGIPTFGSETLLVARNTSPHSSDRMRRRRSTREGGGLAGGGGVHVGDLLRRRRSSATHEESLEVAAHNASLSGDGEKDHDADLATDGASSSMSTTLMSSLTAGDVGAHDRAPIEWAPRPTIVSSSSSSPSASTVPTHQNPLGAGAPALNDLLGNYITVGCSSSSNVTSKHSGRGASSAMPSPPRPSTSTPKASVYNSSNSKNNANTSTDTSDSALSIPTAANTQDGAVTDNNNNTTTTTTAEANQDHPVSSSSNSDTNTNKNPLSKLSGKHNVKGNNKSLASLKAAVGSAYGCDNKVRTAKKGLMSEEEAVKLELQEEQERLIAKMARNDRLATVAQRVQANANAIMLMGAANGGSVGSGFCDGGGGGGGSVANFPKRSDSQSSSAAMLMAPPIGASSVGSSTGALLSAGTAADSDRQYLMTPPAIAGHHPSGTGFAAVARHSGAGRTSIPTTAPASSALAAYPSDWPHHRASQLQIVSPTAPPLASFSVATYQQQPHHHQRTSLASLAIGLSVNDQHSTGRNFSFSHAAANGVAAPPPPLQRHRRGSMLSLNPKEQQAVASALLTPRHRNSGSANNGGAEGADDNNADTSGREEAGGVHTTTATTALHSASMVSAAVGGRGLFLPPRKVSAPTGAAGGAQAPNIRLSPTSPHRPPIVAGLSNAATNRHHPNNVFTQNSLSTTTNNYTDHTTNNNQHHNFSFAGMNVLSSGAPSPSHSFAPQSEQNAITASPFPEGSDQQATTPVNATIVVSSSSSRRGHHEGDEERRESEDSTAAQRPTPARCSVTSAAQRDCDDILPSSSSRSTEGPQNMEGDRSHSAVVVPTVSVEVFSSAPDSSPHRSGGGVDDDCTGPLANAKSGDTSSSMSGGGGFNAVIRNIGYSPSLHSNPLGVVGIGGYQSQLLNSPPMPFHSNSFDMPFSWATNASTQNTSTLSSTPRPRSPPPHAFVGKAESTAVAGAGTAVAGDVSGYSCSLPMEVNGNGALSAAQPPLAGLDTPSHFHSLGVGCGLVVAGGAGVMEPHQHQPPPLQPFAPISATASSSCINTPSFKALVPTNNLFHVQQQLQRQQQQQMQQSSSSNMTVKGASQTGPNSASGRALQVQSTHVFDDDTTPLMNNNDNHNNSNAHDNDHDDDDRGNSTPQKVSKPDTAPPHHLTSPTASMYEFNNNDSLFPSAMMMMGPGMGTRSRGASTSLRLGAPLLFAAMDEAAGSRSNRCGASTANDSSNNSAMCLGGGGGVQGGVGLGVGGRFDTRGSLQSATVADLIAGLGEEEAKEDRELLNLFGDVVFLGEGSVRGGSPPSHPRHSDATASLPLGGLLTPPQPSMSHTPSTSLASTPQQASVHQNNNNNNNSNNNGQHQQQQPQETTLQKALRVKTVLERTREHFYEALIDHQFVSSPTRRKQQSPMRKGGGGEAVDEVFGDDNEILFETALKARAHAIAVLPSLDVNPRVCNPFYKTSIDFMYCDLVKLPMQTLAQTLAPPPLSTLMVMEEAFMESKIPGGMSELVAHCNTNREKSEAEAFNADLQFFESFATSLRNGIGGFPNFIFPSLSSVLVDLNISNNRLEALPDDIGMFSALKKLTARNNRIRVVPPSLCMCEELVTLDLSNNLLEALPEELEELDNLETLVLDYNRFDHLPPCVFTGMVKLKKLCIIDNSALVRLHCIPMGGNKGYYDDDDEGYDLCDVPSASTAEGGGSRSTINQVKKAKATGVLTLDEESADAAAKRWQAVRLTAKAVGKHQTDSYAMARKVLAEHIDALTPQLVPSDMSSPLIMAGRATLPSPPSQNKNNINNLIIPNDPLSSPTTTNGNINSVIVVDVPSPVTQTLTQNQCHQQLESTAGGGGGGGDHNNNPANNSSSINKATQHSNTNNSLTIATTAMTASFSNNGSFDGSYSPTRRRLAEALASKGNHSQSNNEGNASAVAAAVGDASGSFTLNAGSSYGGELIPSCPPGGMVKQNGMGFGGRSVTTATAANASHPHQHHHHQCTFIPPSILKKLLQRPLAEPLFEIELDNAPELLASYEQLRQLLITKRMETPQREILSQVAEDLVLERDGKLPDVQQLMSLTSIGSIVAQAGLGHGVGGGGGVGHNQSPPTVASSFASAAVPADQQKAAQQQPNVSEGFVGPSLVSAFGSITTLPASSALPPRSPQASLHGNISRSSPNWSTAAQQQPPQHSQQQRSASSSTSLSRHSAAAAGTLPPLMRLPAPSSALHQHHQQTSSLSAMPIIPPPPINTCTTTGLLLQPLAPIVAEDYQSPHSFSDMRSSLKEKSSAPSSGASHFPQTPTTASPAGTAPQFALPQRPSTTTGARGGDLGMPQRKSNGNLLAGLSGGAGNSCSSAAAVLNNNNNNNHTNISSMNSSSTAGGSSISNGNTVSVTTTHIPVGLENLSICTAAVSPQIAPIHSSSSTTATPQLHHAGLMTPPTLVGNRVRGASSTSAAGGATNTNTTTAATTANNSIALCPHAPLISFDAHGLGDDDDAATTLAASGEGNKATGAKQGGLSSTAGKSVTAVPEGPAAQGQPRSSLASRFLSKSGRCDDNNGNDDGDQNLEGVLLPRLEIGGAGTLGNSETVEDHRAPTEGATTKHTTTTRSRDDSSKGGGITGGNRHSTATSMSHDGSSLDARHHHRHAASAVSPHLSFNGHAAASLTTTAAISLLMGASTGGMGVAGMSMVGNMSSILTSSHLAASNHMGPQGAMLLAQGGGYGLNNNNNDDTSGGKEAAAAESSSPLVPSSPRSQLLRDPDYYLSSLVRITWNKTWPDDVMPSLCLGSLRTVQNLETLHALGITHVLTCGRNLDTPIEFLKVYADPMAGNTTPSKAQSSGGAPPNNTSPSAANLHSGLTSPNNNSVSGMLALSTSVTTNNGATPQQPPRRRRGNTVAAHKPSVVRCGAVVAGASASLSPVRAGGGDDAHNISAFSAATMVGSGLNSDSSMATTATTATPSAGALSPPQAASPPSPAAAERDRTGNLRIKQLVLEVDDNESEALSPYFMQAIDFIEDSARCGGKTLVHCFAGVSRSATVVVAYVMFKQMMGAKEALSFVQKKRPCANPNYNFRNQLLRFEAYLKKNGGGAAAVKDALAVKKIVN